MSKDEARLGAYRYGREAKVLLSSPLAHLWLDVERAVGSLRASAHMREMQRIFLTFTHRIRKIPTEPLTTTDGRLLLTYLETEGSGLTRTTEEGNEYKLQDAPHPLSWRLRPCVPIDQTAQAAVGRAGDRTVET